MSTTLDYTTWWSADGHTYGTNRVMVSPEAWLATQDYIESLERVSRAAERYARWADWDTRSGRCTSRYGPLRRPGRR